MIQLDLFYNPNDNKNPVKIENGEYIFMPDFFSHGEGEYYFHKLHNDIIWNQESISVYGKEVNIPRLTAWYGNNDKVYSFSGITLQPLKWTETLLSIKHKVENLVNIEFNSVLLNYYRNGKDSISWHTDAEKELGLNPVIASVSFGSPRKFQLRHINTHEKLELNLTHGSLIIMQGELQHYWQHRIPKTKLPVKERINLTFRIIK